MKDNHKEYLFYIMIALCIIAGVTWYPIVLTIKETF